MTTLIQLHNYLRRNKQRRDIARYKKFISGEAGGGTGGGGGGTGPLPGVLYSDDVFSTYLYTGNGSTQTINNGVDLAGKGGLIWLKQRGSLNSFSWSQHHGLIDTSRGGSSYLSTNNADQAYGGPVVGHTTSGFTLNNLYFNESRALYSSLTFRRAPKFFDVVTYTGNGSANRQIQHSLGQTCGMLIVKRVDSTGDWYCHHVGINANQWLAMNTAAAASAGTNIFFETRPTATDFTVSLATNANGATYVAYLFAHDPSAEGIIQCGSFTTTSSDVNVNLGFEPQFVMMKRADGVSNWWMFDAMRGMTSGGNDAYLLANSSVGEEGAYNLIEPTATGFTAKITALTTNATYIYLAIRRPNKPPTTGAQVYNAIARTGTGVAATVTGVGFAPDLVINQYRATAGSDNWWRDRLRGPYYLKSASTATEVGPSSSTQDITAFLMDGFSVGAPFRTNINMSGNTEIYWNFRRAPGFMDVVCYTGTGVARTVPHNLGVAPELMILKSRSTGLNWYVYHKALGVTGNDTLFLNIDSAAVADRGSYWNNTLPVSAQFSLGTSGNVNTNGATYVAYLFASLSGISKVGSYTGNGGSQTINCGFTTGARFVLIKRADSTGDWYVWDTTRGIVAGNDPHLSLNTTAAEITTDDSIDPDSSGFIVNQVAATGINASGGQYIFLAVA